MKKQRRFDFEQAEQEKILALGQLASGMAHEINNNLSYVKGNVELLGQFAEMTLGRISGESRGKNEKIEFLASEIPSIRCDIDNGLKKLENLARNLRVLYFDDETTVDSFNPMEAVEAAVTMVASKYRERVNFVKNYSPDIPHIQGYPAKLTDVFVNVFTNSAEAISEHGKVSISARHVPDKTGRSSLVEIIVSDTGVGIGDDVLSQVFDPFFSTKQSTSGAGLGLTVAYCVVKKHGGDIRLRSKQGRGTEVEITLPVAREKPAE